jgi:hypothetical protein
LSSKWTWQLPNILSLSLTWLTIVSSHIFCYLLECKPSRAVQALEYMIMSRHQYPFSNCLQENHFHCKFNHLLWMFWTVYFKWSTDCIISSWHKFWAPNKTT